MDTEITLRIDAAGQITVAVNGEVSIHAGSIDEALSAIKTLADEALAGAGAQDMQPQDMAGQQIPDGGQPTPDQIAAAEESGMVQGFRGRGRR